MSPKTYKDALDAETDEIVSQMESRQNADVEIRDAATLVLMRRDKEGPRFLLGQRSKGHQFMPSSYVFPGGRVDEGDEAPPSLSEMGKDCVSSISLHANRPARAFAMTAIRETYEETGLLVGRPEKTETELGGSWQGFFNEGVTPCLQGITFIGRAVTPPGPPRRFDTRFLLADADTVLADNRDPLDGAELSDLQWFDVETAQTLDLPSVTRFVLEDIMERLNGSADSQRPFNWYWSQSGVVHERI